MSEKVTKQQCEVNKTGLWSKSGQTGFCSYFQFHFLNIKNFTKYTKSYQTLQFQQNSCLTVSFFKGNSENCLTYIYDWAAVASSGFTANLKICFYPLSLFFVQIFAVKVNVILVCIIHNGDK